MKLVEVVCVECGNRQEDIKPTLGAPDWDPCNKCGSKSFNEVTGEIGLKSSQKTSAKVTRVGAGPWG